MVLRLQEGTSAPKLPELGRYGTLSEKRPSQAGFVGTIVTGSVPRRRAQVVLFFSHSVVSHDQLVTSGVTAKNVLGDCSL